MELRLLLSLASVPVRLTMLLADTLRDGQRDPTRHGDVFQVIVKFLSMFRRFEIIRCQSGLAIICSDMLKSIPIVTVLKHCFMNTCQQKSGGV